MCVCMCVCVCLPLFPCLSMAIRHISHFYENETLYLISQHEITFLRMQKLLNYLHWNWRYVHLKCIPWEKSRKWQLMHTLKSPNKASVVNVFLKNKAKTWINLTNRPSELSVHVKQATSIHYMAKIECNIIRSALKTVVFIYFCQDPLKHLISA